MAKISSANERIISIKSFLGLNENPDGDTSLKNGEAAVMSNFKITDDGSLQIRGGTRDVASLLPASGYSLVYDSSATILQIDPQTPVSKFNTYASIAVSSSNGLITLSGISAELNKDNAAALAGTVYYRDLSGRVWHFEELAFVESTTGIKVTGGSVTIGSEEVMFNHFWTRTANARPDLRIDASGVHLYGNVMVAEYSYDTIIGAYYSGNKTYADEGAIYRITKVTYDYSRGDVYLYGNLVTFDKNDVYEWRFKEVTATNSYPYKAVQDMWAGYVNKTEYLVAACGGKLWALTETDGTWTKTEIGSINTSSKVHFFGMEEKLYILTATEYKVWDGTALADVEGYAPLIAVATPPTGGGTVLEQVNNLTGKKRQKFSPNGVAINYQLAETNIASVDWVKLNGVTLSLGVAGGYSYSLTSGTVNYYNYDTDGYLVNMPFPAGTNTLEVQWTKGSGNRAAVLGMRYSEFFNGSNDTRVFLYGDATNNVIYSGIDENGQPRADYFPEFNTVAIGDANTPVTGLTKHYDTLIAFKENSAYSVTYGTLTFEDGTTNAGFYVLPLNKTIGNTALGQAMLVENNPRTLDGRSVYEWQGVSSTLTNDQRNARRISQRIETTLREIDFSNASAYFDKINHEYYIMQGGMALVQNTENDTWYVYRNFPATCMIVYKDEVYVGTGDGSIRHFSRDYLNDNGEPIAAYFESGSMDFGAGHKKKSSRELWISLKPEEYSGLNVTVQTDAQNDFQDAALLSDYTVPASNGVFTSFFDLDFSRFSFGTNNKPQTKRLKIRARNFRFYKLIFTSKPDLRATILGADIQASYLGNVR